MLIDSSKSHSQMHIYQILGVAGTFLINKKNNIFHVEII